MTTRPRKKGSARAEAATELDEREKQIRKDYDWVLRGSAIQEQHAGKVVAVHKRKVWGVGDSHAAALNAAQQIPGCPPRQELALVYVEGRTVA